MRAAGYPPIPSPPSKRAADWTLPEGWVLQPFVPSMGHRREGAIVGRGYVFSSVRLAISYRAISFQEAPMSFRGNLLLGTIVKGLRRRDRSGHIIVHDVVSELPFHERMDLLNWLVPKTHPVVTLALPDTPSFWSKPEVAIRDKWPEVGWYAKKIDAPVRLTERYAVVTDSWVLLDRQHVTAIGKKNPPCWATALP
jgi:hypothetical protein